MRGTPRECIEPPGSFFIDLIGCEKRKLDAERVRKFFLANGYTQIVDEGEVGVADFVVLIACAFNDEFAIRSKRRIDDLLSKKKGEAKLLLGGCFPDIESAFLKSRDIAMTFGTRDFNGLEGAINAQVPLRQIPDQNISFFDKLSYPVPDQDYRTPLLEEYVRSKNDYKIRVCWGCLSNCSYCVIKKATKGLHSKSLEEIEDEIERGRRAGHQSFFITGDDVGAYGQDINESLISLFKLITSFSEVDLFVQEINAQWFVKYSEEVAKVLDENQNNYRRLFLNVPIQSGSQKILEKMRRAYGVRDAEKAIERVRCHNPKVRVGSHFIVGFPGETREDFEQTLATVNRLDLDFLMAFTYTDHPEADSRYFGGKVDNKEAAKRRVELLGAQKQLDIGNGRYTNLIDLDFPAVLSIGNTIPGWLTDKEAELLYEVGKTTRGGSVVEIGSWMGKSTFFLGAGSLQGEGAKIISIDHHSGSKEHRERSSSPVNTLDQFVNNMRRTGVAPALSIYVMDSCMAKDNVEGPVAALFIDGSHEYEDVKLDFDLWWPKVISNGKVLFHDSITKPGVNRLVTEIASKDDVRFLRFVDETSIFQKTKMSQDDRQSNRLAFRRMMDEQIDLVRRIKSK